MRQIVFPSILSHYTMKNKNSVAKIISSIKAVSGLNCLCLFTLTSIRLCVAQSQNQGWVLFERLCSFARMHIMIQFIPKLKLYHIYHFCVVYSSSYLKMFAEMFHCVSYSAFLSVNPLIPPTPRSVPSIPLSFSWSSLSLQFYCHKIDKAKTLWKTAFFFLSRLTCEKQSCWEEDEVMLVLKLSKDQRQIEELSLKNWSLTQGIVQAENKLWDPSKDFYRNGQCM